MNKELHDWDRKKHEDELGITAKVNRHTETGEPIIRANRALGDIGNFIKEDTGVMALKECDYVGSTAVHIFLAPALGQYVFVSQTSPLARTPEITADAALRQLRGDVMESFGRRRQQKRSGV